MNLNELRKKIDGIDEQLLKLFEERMAVVAEVASCKKAEGLPVLNAQREEEKLNAFAEKASPEMKEYARNFCTSLLTLARRYQYAALKHGPNELKQDGSNICEIIFKAKEDFAAKPFPTNASVACQGMEASFSELAANKLFNKQQSIQYMKTYDSVFSAVENGFCDYGVLPFENSTGGSVGKVYRAMDSHKFRIVRSTRLQIDHQLVAAKGVKIEDIREIISHEQALAQCEGYLGRLGKKLNAELTQSSFNNTAAAAEFVASSGRRDLAAICSYHCAEHYNLDILAENIQDNPNNFTRFICISRNLEIYDNATHTDMIITLQNEQGILNKVLNKVDELEIDMGKLESRPSDRADEFMFYITFNTPLDEKRLKNLFDGLTGLCKKILYLGSYAEVV
ncbi:MAG: chorismate mutase [Defluviitaleaceae bacterium]|nr:chorismate mutase [Defluviitaleaceae bacterium]